MLNSLVKSRFSTQAFRFVKDLSPKVTISKLDFGPILLTEKSGFPSYSDISICFRAGVRDEKPSERGSVFNLKQYLYHTYDNHFLENFESVLRTGCLLDVNFDQELTYFKCSFIQEDFDQQLDTLLKLVLSQKQISEEHRLQYQQEENKKIDISFDELIFKAAFKGQQMGNCSSIGQIEIPSAQDFMNFQKNLLTPHNMAIGYAGVLNHDQIANIINEKIQNYPEFLNQRQLRNTNQAYFTHGTYKEETDSEELNIAVIFQGLPWSHPNMAVLQVLNSIVGNASSWSSGGPGKGMRSRATINMMNSVQSIESAAGVNHHFTDSGLFGLKVSGYYKDSKQLLETVIKELKLLTIPIPNEEFYRGMNILNSQIQLNLERQADRLEEQVKNMFTFNRLASPHYHEKISAVTNEQALGLAQDIILKSDPVVIYQGKGALQMPEMEKVVTMLRK